MSVSNSDSVRTQGKRGRLKLTDTLKRVGIPSGKPYATITNAGYCALFGMPARQLRIVREVPPSADLRDYLTHTELASVWLYEDMAANAIITSGATTVSACCEIVSGATAQAR